eukprot:UN02380
MKRTCNEISVERYCIAKCNQKEQRKAIIDKITLPEKFGDLQSHEHTINSATFLY